MMNAYPGRCWHRPTTYGRSSGLVVDPIEKKPLNHFYPGSSVLSFGTAALVGRFADQSERFGRRRTPVRLAEKM